MSYLSSGAMRAVLRQAALEEFRTLEKDINSKVRKTYTQSRHSSSCQFSINVLFKGSAHLFSLRATLSPWQIEV